MAPIQTLSPRGLGREVGKVELCEDANKRTHKQTQTAASHLPHMYTLLWPKPLYNFLQPSVRTIDAAQSAAEVYGIAFEAA